MEKRGPRTEAQVTPNFKVLDLLDTFSVSLLLSEYSHTHSRMRASVPNYIASILLVFKC